MAIEISAALAALFFAILVVFVVKTLISLQRTLKKVNILLDETAIKARQLDGLMQSLSNVGDICERETDRLKKGYTERKMAREREEDLAPASEWAEWLALSLKIGAKLLKRK